MSQRDPGTATVTATFETQQQASEGVRTVAVVGPPNSGKSTLFNRLTGLRQKVANYPGVTVEKRVGQARLSGSLEVELVDLPGIYSLVPMSEDEQVAHDVLTGRMTGISPPDAIVLILDSTNLGRHLSFAAPILSLGVPTLVVLNLADDLRRRGGELDLDKLAERLGTPIVLISARTGEGVLAVEEFLEGALSVPSPLELPVIQNVPHCREWSARMGTAAAYAAPVPSLWTRRLDALFLHPLAGPLIFGILVVAVFQTVFTVAVPLMDGMDAAVTECKLANSGVPTTKVFAVVRNDTAGSSRVMDDAVDMVIRITGNWLQWAATPHVVVEVIGVVDRNVGRVSVQGSVGCVFFTYEDHLAEPIENVAEFDVGLP
mgnify:CR=1 FL=1